MSLMYNLLTVFKRKLIKIENLTKKCIYLERAIKFNETCFSNRIYPMHVCELYIYVLIYLITYIYKYI